MKKDRSIGSKIDKLIDKTLWFICCWKYILFIMNLKHFILNSVVETIFWSVPKLLHLFPFPFCWDLLLHLWVVEQTLLPNHRLQQVLCWLEIVPSPIEHLVWDWLLFLFVKAIEVCMSYLRKYVHKHSSTVYLLSGLNVSILLRRSAAWGLMLGKSLSQPCLLLFGNDLMYLIAFSFPMYFISSWDGVPKTEIILCTWSRKSSPGNSGCLPSSSAIMHPVDQISTAFVY